MVVMLGGVPILQPPTVVVVVVIQQVRLVEVGVLHQLEVHKVLEVREELVPNQLVRMVVR